MHSAAPPTAGMGLSIAVFAFISTAMLWSMYVPTLPQTLASWQAHTGRSVLIGTHRETHSRLYGLWLSLAPP
jgi:hypothetical protein